MRKRRRDGEVQSSSYRIINRDVEYNVRNIINNRVMAMSGDRWVIEKLGVLFHKLYICLTSELYT